MKPEQEPVTYQCLGCVRACATAYTPLSEHDKKPSLCLMEESATTKWELIRVGEVD